MPYFLIQLFIQPKSFEIGKLSPFFTIQHRKWNDFLYDIKGPYKNNCQYHQNENEISISEEKI